MTLRIDLTSGMNWIPAMIVVLTFLVYTINSVGNYFTLTSTQAAYVGFVGFVLAGLVTVLTTEEEQAPLMEENMVKKL